MRMDDMGDDEQEDEIREYERYIEDPPRDLRIENREDETGEGINDELRQEWTRRDRDADDDRPAEVAAMEIEDDRR
jgi:hypothetical protein